MIYAGQETENEYRPSLFEKDTVNWNTGYDLSKFMAAMYKIKKNPLFANSRFYLHALPCDILLAAHKGQSCCFYGVFSLKGFTSVVSITDIQEGEFTNLIDGAAFRIEDHKLSCQGTPVIFRYPL
ncbi:MAG: hypothetical protein LBH43_14490 [Treponema sp.]|jgi:hypothetical protein|nr:hypothetical protein [Treponema sp.]